jgi:hypothetical protein
LLVGWAGGGSGKCRSLLDWRQRVVGVFCCGLVFGPINSLQLTRYCSTVSKLCWKSLALANWVLSPYLPWSKGKRRVEGCMHDHVTDHFVLWSGETCVCTALSSPRARWTIHPQSTLNAGWHIHVPKSPSHFRVVLALGVFLRHIARTGSCSFNVDGSSAAKSLMTLRVTWKGAAVYLACPQVERESGTSCRFYRWWELSPGPCKCWACTLSTVLCPQARNMLFWRVI